MIRDRQVSFVVVRSITSTALGLIRSVNSTIVGILMLFNVEGNGRFVDPYSLFRVNLGNDLRVHYAFRVRSI